MVALTIMARPLRAEEGLIFWEGQEMKTSKLTAKIGVVMQNQDKFFSGRTVLQELILWRGKTPDDVRRVMKMVGLLDVPLLEEPTELSDGQKKRLAMASQLMRDPLPKLFLLDEPFGGVHRASREQILRLSSKTKNLFSVVIVTHEPGNLVEYADRLVQIAQREAIEVP